MPPPDKAMWLLRREAASYGLEGRHRNARWLKKKLYQYNPRMRFAAAIVALPLMAAFFRGRIEQTIREQLVKLLS